MLNLKTRVKLEEVELVVGVGVEIFDGTSGYVTDETTKRDSGLLHVLESLRAGNRDGSLFDNLLMTTLNGTITSEKRDVVSVLVSKKLYFQVASATRELHDEDRRTRDFVGGGLVESSEVLFAADHTNTLTTTTFGSLDHDGETNLASSLQTLFRCVYATKVVD